MQIDVKIDQKKILDKVTNDRFGLFVSQSWKRLIDPYTPRRSGQLMGITGVTVDIQPFELHYNTNYAEYVYFSEEWDFFKELNPFATDHWDEKAATAGQTDKLYRTLTNYINRE